MGEVVSARLIRAKDGVKEIKGVLKDYDNGYVTIERDDGAQFVIDTKETSYIKLCDDEDLF